MPSARLESRFAEPDAARILQRAAELQREASDPGRISLAELEDAAAAAGIEAAHVRRAAAELELQQARRDRPGRLLGGPRTLLLEITLDGEIPVPAYEHVIEALRRATGELGSASLIGRSLTWTALPRHGNAGRGWSRTLALTIVPRGGRTRIRLEEKLDALARHVFAGGLAGLGSVSAAGPIVGLALLGVPGWIPLGVGLWLGGGWALARRVYRARVAARARELDLALAAIVEIADEWERRRLPAASG